MAYQTIEGRDERGNTPLLKAIQESDLETAQWLLGVGANILAKNNAGQSIKDVAESTLRNCEVGQGSAEMGYQLAGSLATKIDSIKVEVAVAATEKAREVVKFVENFEQRAHAARERLEIQSVAPMMPAASARKARSMAL